MNNVKKVTKERKEKRPRGRAFDAPHLDKEDAPILEELARIGRCQQRLRVDSGRHYIFCGAYNQQLDAVHTERGLRCIFHR